MQRRHARDQREADLRTSGHKFAHLMRIGEAGVRSSMSSRLSAGHLPLRLLAISSQSSRIPASGASDELALSATLGHWPAHRLRRSNVSGAQVPDIQIRARSRKSSALCEAEVMSSMLVGRGCCGAHSIVGLSAAIREFFRHHDLCKIGAIRPKLRFAQLQVRVSEEVDAGPRGV
jgi:hypothetical protein